MMSSENYCWKVQNVLLWGLYIAVHQYIQLLLRCLALAVLGSQFTYYYLLGVRI